MRPTSLLPLLTIAALAGCGSDSTLPPSRETRARTAEGAGLPDRALTLQVPVTSAVEVASAVELSRPAPEPGSARRHRVAPKRAPSRAEPQMTAPSERVASTPSVATAGPAPQPAPRPVPAEAAPGQDGAAGAGRELAPGETVTVIPASNGPSAAPEEPAWAPSDQGRGVLMGGGGHGDRCRPRGGVRGIGITGRIPHGVPAIGLR